MAMRSTLRQLLPSFLALLLMPVLGGAEGYGDDFYEEDVPAEEASDDPPMLGIQMTPPPRRVLESEGLDADEGVYVFRTYPDTAAEQLGLQPGDVITEVNGEPISSMSDLREIVAGSKVGEEAQVTISRNGQRQHLSGASFRPWPESIPQTPIDAAAEQRYRDAQMRREETLARRAQEHEQLKERTEAMRQQLDQAAAQLPDMGQANRRNNAIVAATGRDAELLPQGLMALPGWRFGYEFDVAGAEPEVAAARESIAIAPNVAPPIDLAVEFTVHGGSL